MHGAPNSRSAPLPRPRYGSPWRGFFVGSIRRLKQANRLDDPPRTRPLVRATAPPALRPARSRTHPPDTTARVSPGPGSSFEPGPGPDSELAREGRALARNRRGLYSTGQPTTIRDPFYFEREGAVSAPQSFRVFGYSGHKKTPAPKSEGRLRGGVDYPVVTSFAGVSKWFANTSPVMRAGSRLDAGRRRTDPERIPTPLSRRSVSSRVFSLDSASAISGDA